MSRLIRSVACAVSGGVDSAVSAYLLKLQGFHVSGVFMTNWDPLDEDGLCSTSKDKKDAQYICDKLDIPFYDLTFVREYWLYVFEPLLKYYEYGWTPNPDVLCNRFIKFNFFANKVLRNLQQQDDPSQSSKQQCSLLVDAIATGHYCQNSFGNYLQKCSSERPFLMRSADPVKDQTFWLSTISENYLRYCMFPVGGLLKPTVKAIATDVGLSAIAARPESMGMCFIGKRRFADFIDCYITPKRGLFKEFGTGIVLGEHRGIHHYTLGQKASITHANGPFYIVRMEFSSQDVYVARDPYHPALFMRQCWTGPAVWIASEPPALPSEKIDFQWQNKWRSVKCKIWPHGSMRDAAASIGYKNGPMVEHANHLLSEVMNVGIENGRPTGPYLSIELEVPMRCIAAGQWAALYEGDRCIGGVPIAGSMSLWEEGMTESYTNWNNSDFLLNYG